MKENIIPSCVVTAENIRNIYREVYSKPFKVFDDKTKLYLNAIAWAVPLERFPSPQNEDNVKETVITLIREFSVLDVMPSYIYVNICTDNINIVLRWYQQKLLAIESQDDMLDLLVGFQSYLNKIENYDFDISIGHEGHIKKPIEMATDLIFCNDTFGNQNQEIAVEFDSPYDETKEIGKWLNKSGELITFN